MPHRQKILYRDHLLERIPEAFQDSEDLADFIRVCGTLFDDASDQIKLHDWYEDYRRTPEERLGLLLDKYGIDITRNLPEDIIRSIVRDIHTIYTTNGTQQAFHWVFRLLGIEYTAEKAWLIDPHLYFPDVEFEERSPFDRQEEGEILLPIGTTSSDSYIIGEDDQFWLLDTDFRIIGVPVIGYNATIDESEPTTGDPLLDQALKQRSFNYNEFDYRNFVYGDSVDQSNGTYFYGRSFNSDENNVEELRIVGETYEGGGVTRSSKFVMATPYLLLTISGEDFSRFINSYATDDNAQYVLSPADRARLVEYLFEYLLMDVVKPSTVVILSITQHIDNEEIIEMSTSIDFDFSDIALTLDDDLIRMRDNLTLEREANIPDVNPSASFICLYDAPVCESHLIAIGDPYTIGVEDQVYHKNTSLSATGHLVIGFNEWCENDSQFMYGSEVTVTWDELTGVDGYRVYKSDTSFTESNLPSPVRDITGSSQTEYRHYADNDEQYYYAIEPYIKEGSTISSMAFVDIQGCVDPFDSFTLSGEGVCMIPVEPFSFVDSSITCPSLLEPFSVSNGVVGCDSVLTQFTIDATVDCDSVLVGFSTTNGVVECNPVLRGFSVTGDNTDCDSVLTTFSVSSSTIDCDSVLTTFSVNNGVVTCDVNDVTHPPAIGEGYVIGGTDEESHLYTGFTASGETLIGDNIFYR